MSRETALKRRAHCYAPLLLCILALIGCGKQGNVESTTAGHAVIGVSDAAYKMAWQLSDAFRAQYPSAFVDIVREDSRVLLDSLLNGKTEQIFLDRPIARDESLVFKQTNIKLLTYPVAYYPVFLLVSRENPVLSLDSASFRGILTGSISNWKQLGGMNEPIRLYVPESREGAMVSVLKFYGGLDSIVAEVCSTATVMLSKAKDDDGVLLVYSQPIEELPYRPLRWVVAYEMVYPDVETILEGPIYPFRLLLTYMTTRSKLDLAAGYLTFLVGNLGQRTFLEAGYRPAAVPVKITRRNS